jgi:hypothetical protein
MLILLPIVTILLHLSDLMRSFTTSWPAKMGEMGHACMHACSHSDRWPALRARCLLPPASFHYKQARLSFHAAPPRLKAAPSLATSSFK